MNYIIDMNITSRVARRQAEICLALIREIDQAVVKNGQPADQVLARIYRLHREYGARDRRFFSNAVFSWFRWRGWLETPANANIAAAILLDATEIPPQLEYFGLNSSKADLKPAGRLTLEEKAEYLRRQLRFSSLQIDECRGRACACPPAGNAGRGTAGRSSERSPTSGAPTILKFPSIELVPDWFFEVVFVPEQKEHNLHFKQCLESFQTRPPTWLRLPRFQYEQALHLLRQAGIETETHSLIKQAAFIKGQKSFDSALFPKTEVQDLASQCVGICCSPEPGEKWWDVCAGSGGKSLHLADLTRDNGFILATDVRPAILKQLAGRLKRNKYRSINISLWDGVADPAPEVYFDGVLVDAPCSGLGTWHRNPDARWRTSAIQIRDYANVQRNLLQLAAGKVRPGGKLIYSACTLTKAENADVISHFLEKRPEFQLEQIVNPLNDQPNNGIIWVWPWEWNSNGMFIAVMKKA